MPDNKKYLPLPEMLLVEQLLGLGFVPCVFAFFMLGATAGLVLQILSELCYGSRNFRNSDYIPELFIKNIISYGERRPINMRYRLRAHIAHYLQICQHTKTFNRKLE